MKADIILGLQWGDEGKGKIVDLLTPQYNIVARFQGGPNAGHTIEAEGFKHVLHLIPSGIFHPEIINIIGNGVIIDPFLLMKEVDGLYKRNVYPESKLFIAKKAHLILPSHRLMDACKEGNLRDKKIGSTLKGIGPTYTDKTARQGLRIGEIFTAGFMQHYNSLKDHHLRYMKQNDFNPDTALIDGMGFAEYEAHWMESVERARKFQFVDCEHFINKLMDEGNRVLAEGAQGTLLDVDFGSYPFVTSSNTTTGGACTGLGIAPNRIGEVFGIFKAYCTRVGNGPFPTEQDNEHGEKLRRIGREFGATTGRPRRCGWLDIPALKYAVMINGVTQLVMMKSDVLGECEEIPVCTSYNTSDGSIDYLPYNHNTGIVEPVYETLKGWNVDLSQYNSVEDLPLEFKTYISYIEKEINLPVTILSTGPERTQTLMKSSLIHS